MPLKEVKLYRLEKEDIDYWGTFQTFQPEEENTKLEDGDTVYIAEIGDGLTPVYIETIIKELEDAYIITLAIE